MKMKHCLDSLFLCCCACLLCVGTWLCAEEPSSSTEGQEIKISADSMEMKMDNHVVELEGNVLIEDSKMSLTAKKMTVYLDKGNKLRNIEAVGGVTVRMLSTSESANGDTGVYDATADIVTLRGNCVLMQGNRTVTGNRVVYNRKLGTIRLSGGTITIPLNKTSKGDDPLGGLLGVHKDKEKDKDKAEKPDEKKDEAEPEKGEPASEEQKH